MKSTLSEKGQITIPKEIREKHGLMPGCDLEFQSDGGAIRIIKVIQSDPLDRWRGKGSIPGFTKVNDYLNAIRDEERDR